MAKAYTNGFYSSKRWIDCRDSYLRTQDYICERCGKPAKIVHHKEYITPKTINDPSVTLAHDNLEALCQDCHNREHHKDNNNTRQDVMFDESGNLIPVRPLGEY
jgi:5-methylcytosine-specific restriction endonuclease McrA